MIFFDEMEALFRTRGTGISSDVETMVVPQLLAEMDGVESLDNVVIVGASNRADMIDQMNVQRRIFSESISTTLCRLHKTVSS